MLKTIGIANKNKAPIFTFSKIRFAFHSSRMRRKIGIDRTVILWYNNFIKLG